MHSVVETYTGFDIRIDPGFQFATATEEPSFQIGNENLKMSELNELKSELNDDERLILLSELQFDYEVLGGYKSLEEYAEKFSVSEEEMRLHLGSISEKINNRGLPPIPYINLADNRFKHDLSRPDPTFMMVAQEILDVSDTRSLSAKIKKFNPIGVTTKTWTNWMKNPVNSNYFDEELKKRLNKDTLRMADLSLSRNVASGDLPSIKYVNELTGRYRPQTENVQNFGILLQMVMGILARTLTAEQLDKVADELETLPIFSKSEAIEATFSTQSPVGELEAS